MGTARTPAAAVLGFALLAPGPAARGVEGRGDGEWDSARTAAADLVAAHGDWCRDHSWRSLARHHYEAALRLEPGNAAADAGLGSLRAPPAGKAPVAPPRPGTKGPAPAPPAPGPADLAAAAPVTVGNFGPAPLVDLALAALLKVRIPEGVEGRGDRHLVAALDGSGRIAAVTVDDGDVSIHRPAGRWKIEVRGPKGFRRSGSVVMPASGEEELVLE